MLRNFDELWDRSFACAPLKPAVHALIGGSEMVFHTSSSWVSFFISQILNHHLLDAGGKVEPRRKLQILISAAPEGIEKIDKDADWSGRLSDGTTIRIQRSCDDEHGCLMTIGDEVGARFDFTSGRALCLVAETRVGRNKFRRPQPGGYLLPIIQFMLSAFNIYTVHASAVAVAGRAVLLLGDSGAGKTTMSLALARQGLQFMGDDLVIVEIRNKTPKCHSLLLKAKIVNGDQSKSLQDPESFDGVNICREAELGTIALLSKRRTGNYKFIKKEPTETFAWLMRQGNNLKFVWDSEGWIDTAMLIAERVPGVMWEIGSPDELVTDGIRKIINQGHAG